MPLPGRMPVTVEMFEDAEMQDALVIVAFPSTGAAAPIAGAYLHKRLDLPLVGHLVSEDLDGISHIEAGIAASPVRIHGGETACDVGGPCPRIFTVTSEVPVPMELLPEVADAVVRWASTARMVLSLDAVGREQGDDTPDVYAGGATPGALAALQNSKAETLGKGLIGGLTAHLLARGRGAGFHAATLIVEASQNHPDGRAAAALVEALDRLIPEMRVDPKPLLEDAMELEAEVKKAMDAAQAAQPRRQQHTFI